MEFEFFVSRSTITNYFIQSLQNPAIDERCSRRRRCRSTGVIDPGYSRKIVKITNQNAQRVPNAAIRVAEAREHFLGERNVGGVIDAAGPKPKQICAVPTDEMIGGCRFLIRSRFGNLFSVEIDDEPVSDANLVRRAIIKRDTGHERRLKPAAMLIRSFEIHVSRIALFMMQCTACFMRNDAVDSDLNRIVA